MKPLKPYLEFGAYELERKLGSGGMAEVWLAHPTSPGQRHPRVVLKRMHGHLAEDPRVVELFMEEARLAQLLRHPNIVNVFDSGEVDGEWYIAMEYVDGIDLRSALAAHGGPLLPAFAGRLIADAAAGLHYAHTLKGPLGKPLHIVHRDLSPDNLMVDRKGVVRLVDFGIARAATTEHTTLTGLRKGKVRYLAPEYMQAHRSDARSDVYALGATLYELVTGQLPFGHLRATPAIYQAMISTGLPRADSVRPSLPRELCDVIAAATAVKPLERLGSAKELRDRLLAFFVSFAPPSHREIGAEVLVWKQKLSMTAPLRRREAGSYGQLESTEVLSRPSPPPLPKRAGRGAPPSVVVAHQTDRTNLSLPMVLDDAVDDTDPAMPAHRSEPNVIVDPELLATPRPKPRVVKKPKRRSPR